MTNVTLNFIFKGEKISIQCKNNELMKNIFEYYSKNYLKMFKIYFFYIMAKNLIKTKN